MSAVEWFVFLHRRMVFYISAITAVLWSGLAAASGSTVAHLHALFTA
jgi:hypothetical protein